MVFLESLSLVTSASVSEIFLYINPTLSGASYTPVDAANSVVQIDTSATITSPGRLVATIYNGTSNTVNFNDLKNFNIYLAPGDVLLVAGLVKAGTATVQTAIEWQEKR